jgi:hypothetical protein
MNKKKLGLEGGGQRLVEREEKKKKYSLTIDTIHPISRIIYFNVFIV